MNRKTIITAIVLIVTNMVSCQSLPDKDNKVWVVAHRGDWRNAPENSLAAIERSIEMGVDMVEIDIRMTKEGQYVLMHDKTLDRTTNGSGKVKDYTADEVSQLKLLNGYGMETDHKVPLLVEALELCKGRVAIFLDKSYYHMNELHKVVDEMDMNDQVYFEGKGSLEDLDERFRDLNGSIHYMPRISDKSHQIDELTAYNQTWKTSLYIFSIDSEVPASQLVKQINENGGRAMAISLWGGSCAGHSDDLSVSNPDSGWGWLVNTGFKAICTDRPAELIQYLQKNNLHK